MKIGLIGAGRLGVCFALLCEQAGYEVLVSDIREEYVNALQRKEIFTNEPDVEWLLRASKNFEATTDNQRVINECDIVYTLVATPSLQSGDYDVSAVWKVVDDIVASGVKDKSFIVGCTTNPGDCSQFQEKLGELGWDVFYNPEFIAQGSIIRDLQNADMVLVGGKQGNVYDELCTLYNKIQVTPPKISLMSTTAAELVKLSLNCFVTTKISYANMIGEIATCSGIEDEIDNILETIGCDSRVGHKCLKYGYGFGGPCLPRDNKSLAMYAKKLGLEHPIGVVTDKINDEHAKFLCNKIIVKNKKNLPFYFDYIAYKKGVDILTESQQYKLCLDLLDAGYTVYIDDIEPIIKQVKTDLSAKYGDRVRFGKAKEEVFTINL